MSVNVLIVDDNDLNRELLVDGIWRVLCQSSCGGFFYFRPCA